MSFNKAQDETLKAFSWVFLVFIIKELIMVVFGGIMLLLNLRPSAAEIFGKIATFAFYFIMILIVAFGPEVGMLRDVLTNSTPFVLVKRIYAIAAIAGSLTYYLMFILNIKTRVKKF